MLEHLLPKSAEVRHVTEALELHQAAIDFQRELEHRQAFEDYCQWYYRIAEQNRAEMASMKTGGASFSGWWNPHKTPSLNCSTKADSKSDIPDATPPDMFTGGL